MAKGFSKQEMVRQGQRLAATRIALGYPHQEDLAKVLGIGRSRLAEWERGRLILNIKVAMDLCDKFNLTLDWLYRGNHLGIPHGIATKLRTATNWQTGTNE